MTSVYVFGDKPAGAVILEHMLSLGWDVKAVVSAMVERRFLSGPSMQSVARAHGIPYITQAELLHGQPEKADLVISYMYRNRVKQESLDLATLAAVNFHPAPLPRFGGWAYYNVALLENEPEYGVTCHHMDIGFDTGALCMQRFFPIDAARETALSLEQKAQAEMVRLFADFCAHVQLGHALPNEPQDKQRMRYMKKEEFDALKRIPNGADEETAQRYARAFWYPPFDLAYIDHNGARLEIIPRIVKGELAKEQHRDDYSVLAEALAGHIIEKESA